MNDAPQLRAPAGYGPVAPLDRIRHAGLGVTEQRSLAWSRQLNAATIGVPEFARAAIDFPLAFVKNGLEQAQPIAVLGLRDAENLFVDADGHWQADHYLPASLRQHPFCLVDRGGPEQSTLIAVEEQSLVPEGAVLFDANGHPTEAWTPWKALLDALDRSRRVSRQWTGELERHGLLVPFDTLSAPRAGSALRLRGLYRVDETALSRLPPDILAQWAGNGALRAIYSHLVSLENFAKLMLMASRRPA